MMKNPSTIRPNTPTALGYFVPPHAILCIAAAACLLALPVAVDADLVGTHTVATVPDHLQQDTIGVISASNTNNNINSNNNGGCTSTKTISLTQFCIGEHSGFEEFATHEFYLNGFLATPPQESFAKGDCHVVTSTGRTLTSSNNLRVGLRESDDFHDESVSYTLPPALWYNSESCRTYEIVVSRKNTGDHEWTGCWRQKQPPSSSSPASTSMALMRCEEGWEYPGDAFVWYLRVDPDDGGAPLPVGSGIANPNNSNIIEDPSIWFGDEESASASAASNTTTNALRGPETQPKPETNHAHLIIVAVVVVSLFALVAIAGGCYMNYEAATI